MTIHLDTSALIDICARTRPLLPACAAATREGHRFAISAVAMYEWLRGPRHDFELGLQREISGPERIVVFGEPEADVAAQLYRRVSRARGRDLDIAIAACAIVHRAALWTSNVEDYRDIPGLRLYQP